MKRSFTLIELMVVIGLVVLLTVGTIAGISASRSKKQVKATADRLRSVISDAVSYAQHPSDTDFGLQKIQIRIYPWNSSDLSGLENVVKVYNISTTGVEVEKNSFKAPGGVYLNSDNPPDSGNMRCPPLGSCGVNPTYYYFSVWASSNQVGQITDITSGSAEDKVYLTVSDTQDRSGQENYKVKVFINSGLVTVE